MIPIPWTRRQRTRYASPLWVCPPVALMLTQSSSVPASAADRSGVLSTAVTPVLSAARTVPALPRAELAATGAAFGAVEIIALIAVVLVAAGLAATAVARKHRARQDQTPTDTIE